jgi:uncharacterized protein (DUF924 family)
MTTSQEILDYWFGVPPSSQDALWWRGGKKVDDEMRARFGDTIERAAKGDLDGWAETARGRLALVLLCDQFPRNVYRGTARAFATDAKAQALTKDALADGIDRGLSPHERMFLYMPLMHAEDRAMQRTSVDAFERLVREAPEELRASLESNAKYARQHASIVERFGRYPHRNALLGRPATDEETAYLIEHPENFGAG